jgi:hypothetical protein
MKSQLARLKEIENKAQIIANKIDVNDEESQKQYEELAQLANELGGVINAVEAA